MTQSSTLFRVLGLSLLVALASLAVSSCINPPDYPDTPSIEFKTITKERFRTDGGLIDSVKVTVSFKDGDGDLGLSNQDTNPPYDYGNGQNRYYNNYFIQPQIQQTDGTFKNYDVGTGGYDSRYPVLNTSGRSEPLKGDLTLNLVFSAGLPFRAGTVVRFQVNIVDRALNESNVITTEPITF